MAINDATQTTFTWGGTLVGEVLSVTPPSITVDSIAQPKLGGTVKQKRPSSKYDPGQITVTVYAPTGDVFFAEVISDQSTPTAWVITYDDGGTHSGSGFVTSYSPAEHAEDADHTIDVTIENTSTIVYTAPTP